MYIVVRNDLTAGAKLAQSSHAAFLFSTYFPDTTKIWMENSNYICILEANEEQISILINQAIDNKIEQAIFQEPDLNYQITAIAFAPGPKSKKLCSNLKLALKDL